MRKPSHRVIRLGPITLVFVLGLTYDKRLTWTTHHTIICAKGRQLSYLITRIIRAREFPSFKAIRTLTIAALIPLLTYGWPFWKPTVPQFNQLLSLFVRPFKRLLCLPKTTHHVSILADCGILDPTTMWERSVLLFHQRCMDLPSTHPSRQLLATCPRYHEWYTDIRSKWQTVISQTDTLHRAGVLKQMYRWRADNRCTDLTRIRPINTKGIASYLLKDTLPIAILRARLRFNRSYLKNSLYRRFMTDSTECRCEADNEDIAHILYDCPFLIRPRFRLNSHPTLSFNVRILMGEVSHLPARLRRSALCHTARFLSEVADRRGTL